MAAATANAHAPTRWDPCHVAIAQLAIATTERRGAKPTRFAEPESGHLPKARPQRTQHVGLVGRVLSGRKHRRTAKLRLRTRCALLIRHARRVNGPRRRATRRPTRRARRVRMVISVRPPRVLKPKKLRTSVSVTGYARRVNIPALLAHA